MSQTIGGSTAYIPGTLQTVDPDESPDRAEAGYTGVDEAYQNATDKRYAPQGSMKLVPKPVAFGAVDSEDVSDEQQKADEAAAEAARLQAEADAAAAEKAAKDEADRVAEAKAKVEATPAPTPVTTTPVAPEAPKSDSK